MKTPSTTFERLAGVLLLVAAGVGYWSLARERRTRGKSQDEVLIEARAERLAGIVGGSSVRLRGVDVGTVRSIELGSPDDGPRPVRITMAISKEAERWLHDDAKARVFAPLVGPAGIELVEGEGAPRRAGAILEATLEASLAEGLGKIVSDVHGYEARVTTILANVQDATSALKVVTGDLHDPSKPIGAMVADEALTRKLRATVEDVRALASDLRVTGGVLASPTDGVPAAMASTLRTAKNVQETSEALRSETPRILERVDRVAVELERLVRMLHASAALAPEAIASSIAVLDDAQRTLEAVQKNVFVRGNVDPKRGAAGLATPRARALGAQP